LSSPHQFYFTTISKEGVYAIVLGGNVNKPDLHFVLNKDASEISVVFWINF
jgi:hypothetical protein